MSPNGTLIASVSAGTLDKSVGQKVHIWNLVSKKLLHEISFGSNIGTIRVLKFTPDGRHLITANGNGTVYILRLKDWSENMNDLN